MKKANNFFKKSFFDFWTKKKFRLRNKFYVKFSNKILKYKKKRENSGSRIFDLISYLDSEIKLSSNFDLKSNKARKNQSTQ